MATGLSRREVPYALLEFEGEAHGFRSEAARVRTLEAELAFYAGVFGFTPDVAPLALTTDPPAPREEPEDDLPVVEQLPEVTPEAGVTAVTGEPVIREATEPS